MRTERPVDSFTPSSPPNSRNNLTGILSFANSVDLRLSFSTLSSLGESSRKEEESAIERTYIEKTVKPEEQSYPEGGYGWWVVFAAFLSHFIINGTFYVFGVFLQHYANGFYKEKASITTLSFVGTLQSATMSLLGPLAGTLTNKLGYRPTLFIGNLVLTLSLVIASFSTQVWQLFLFHGFTYGMGASLIYFPVISAPSHWFYKRRGLALGIAIAGTGAGGLVMSPTIDALITRVGISWTLRIVAAMSGVLITVVGLLLRLPSDTTSSEVEEKNPSFKDKETSLLRYVAALFKDFRFLLLLSMGFTLGFGYLAPFYLLPSYAVKIGLLSWQGALIGGILSGSDAIGKIGIGFAADYLGRLNVFILCILGSALCCGLLWPLSLNMGVLILFAVCYGLCEGGLVGLFPVVCADLFGVEQLATVIGIQNIAFGITTLVGTPIVSMIGNTKGGGFTTAFIFSGGMIFLATIFVILIRLSLSRKLRIKL